MTQTQSIYSPRFFVFGILLLFYESITTMTHILPPLFGVIFTYLVITAANKELGELDGRFWLGVVFMVVCEQMMGFRLFASIFALMIFYYFIFEYLTIKLHWQRILLVACVIGAYIGVFLANNLMLYIYDENIMPLNGYYFYYIAIESVLAIFLFKDQV